MSDDKWYHIRFDKALTLVGALVLSFLAGSFVTDFELFPYKNLIERGFVALKARQEQQRNLQANSGGQKPKGFNNQKKYEGSGLHKRIPEKSADGYTIFSTGAQDVGARLLAPDGEVVHEWYLPFSEAFPSPSHIDNPVADKNVVLRKVYMRPSGNVIAIYSARFNTDTPNGYGIVELDPRSEVVWRHETHAHHDIDVGPDGKIYTLAHDFRDTNSNPVLGDPEIGTSKHGGRIMEDFVLILSPSGEELRRVSVLDAMKKGSFAETLQAVKNWDVLHTNNIDLIRKPFARHHHFAEPGDVMLSFRTPNSIGLMDPESGRFKWIQRGPWLNQHDPDPLADGNLLLYDNQGLGDHSSRILKFNPDTGALLWTYGARKGTGFASEVNGEQQLLRNGNILVTESKSSRLFEVTPEREIVWDYRMPDSATVDGTTFHPSFLGAKRYPESYLEFDPREVEPEVHGK